MIKVTSKYDENGTKVGEVAQCDCKPSISWTEIIIGILGALIILDLIVVAV